MAHLRLSQFFTCARVARRQILLGAPVVGQLFSNAVAVGGELLHDGLEPPLVVVPDLVSHLFRGQVVTFIQPGEPHGELFSIGQQVFDALGKFSHSEVSFCGCRVRPAARG